MKTSLKIGFLILVCFQSACDKACKKTVEDSTVIENRTGREVSFRVCKTTSVDTQMVDVRMNPSSVPQVVSLGNHREYEVIGGPNLKSCEDKTETSTTAAISLSPSGFAAFKLCYEASTSRSILIEKHHLCPTGTMEQIVPGNCAAP